MTVPSQIPEKPRRSVRKRLSRSARLGFRVEPEAKSRMEQAAALENRTLTEFCLYALTEATRETLARHESLELSARDRQLFFDALIHPPEPHERLQRAFLATQNAQ